MIDRDLIRDQFQAIRPVLNERARRPWAAAEARSLGRGGISAVTAMTGIARDPVHLGIREPGAPLIAVEAEPPPARVRHPGAGRKPLTSTDALDQLAKSCDGPQLGLEAVLGGAVGQPMQGDLLLG